MGRPAVHLRYLVVARHTCGKVVRACVYDTNWPDNADRIAEFRRDAEDSGYPIEEMRQSPAVEDWCNCFRGVS